MRRREPLNVTVERELRTFLEQEAKAHGGASISAVVRQILSDAMRRSEGSEAAA
jgi:hypothetical protein